MFGDDDNCWWRNRNARILIGRCLDAARHHKTDVHAIVHLVGIEHGKQPANQFIRFDTDVHVDRLGAFIEPFDVLVEERNTAMVQAQAFPHAVAEDEACIEHRDHSLAALDKLTVDGNQNVLVARIGKSFMGAFGHVTNPVLTAKPENAAI